MDKSCFVNNIKQCNDLLLLLSCLFLVSSCFACTEHERAALLKFKQAIQVDRCGMLSSWDDHEGNPNCCEWRGVRCSNITGHVVKLSLRGFDYKVEWCLQGKVSSSLVDLKHLRHLDLSFNNFSSQPIPSFIGSLVNLKYLNLSDSEFAGEIPEQLGNLSSLTSLDLVNYDLNVKNLSWLSRLTMLRSISLRWVNLSEATNWLHSVNNLPFLRVLDLESCDLPQPVIVSPLSFQNSSSTLSFLNLSRNKLNDSLILFEWLLNLSGINTHLTHIDLSMNELKGHLPNALGDLHALSYLDLSTNNFEGNIPSSFGNMQSVSYLSLSYNQLEGPIPGTISYIKPLTVLDLLYNNFQSLPPQALGNLCSLQVFTFRGNNLTQELQEIIQELTGCANKSLLYLDLSYNSIWGPIDFDLIGSFSSLRELYLIGNKLSGEISKSLGQLSTMEKLYLTSNYLKGTLSNVHFSNLSSLMELDLAHNSGLELNISADHIFPFQLDSISLSSCQLGPVFPNWLLKQKNYSFLDISYAGISDRIPNTFWSSLPSKVSYLNLSNNEIYGSLPDLSNLKLSPHQFEIIEIDLSYNNLEGDIPSFPNCVDSLTLNDNKFTNSIRLLCPNGMSNLSQIDLSNNFLSGKIPNCWRNFPILSILQLDNNKFSGVLPHSMGYLKNLESLHLRNNAIFGEIPSRLFQNSTSLMNLDFGYNSLSGHIPLSIGENLKNIKILILRNNRFVGRIPLSLCQLSSLKILDLSSNHIVGSVPKCIYNWTAMQDGANVLEYITYGLKNEVIGNYLDVATLTWKRKDRSFQDLNLIKAIDVSSNKLEGEIPDEISNLKGLVFLNLSRNNLIGDIQPKLGQLTNLEFLDLSRNQFSGEIPTSFAELNSLGVLDLSNNQLSGEIPNIPQLQRFDESSYIGNPRLCGLPLPKCSWDRPHDNNASTEDHANHHQDNKDSDDDVFKVGLYISVVLGFIIGFWGVCGTLVLKRSWRHAFFRFLDDKRDVLYYMVSGNMARLRRRN